MGTFSGSTVELGPDLGKAARGRLTAFHQQLGLTLSLETQIPADRRSNSKSGLSWTHNSAPVPRGHPTTQSRGAAGASKVLSKLQPVSGLSRRCQIPPVLEH